MPYKNREDKRVHNKRYKMANGRYLTAQRVLRTHQTRVTRSTYDTIKDVVDPSLWERVEVIEPLCERPTHARPIESEVATEPFPAVRVEAVYIVNVRESVLLNEDVYKIGRTTQSFTKRATSYPKGSVLKIQRNVDDSKMVEAVLIRVFSRTFTARPDRGREYFQGTYEDMEDKFMHIVRRLDDMDA